MNKADKAKLKARVEEIRGEFYCARCGKRLKAGVMLAFHSNKGASFIPGARPPSEVWKTQPYGFHCAISELDYTALHGDDPGL